MSPLLAPSASHYCIPEYVIALNDIRYCNWTAKKTRKRELASLLGTARKLRCDDLWIITNDTTETLQDGENIVHIVAARDWLSRA